MTQTRIMIVGAMDRELSEINKYYSCKEINQLQSHYNVWKSSIDQDTEIILLRTFVGDINATIATTLALDIYNPDYVFKIGCVGGNSEGLYAGDVIAPIGFFSSTAWITKSQINNRPTSNAAVWESIYGDKDYQISRDNLGGLPHYYATETSLLKRYRKYLCAKKLRFATGYIGSGNIWVFDKKYADNTIRSHIPGYKENMQWVADMESYAIAQACRVFKKPFMGFYRVSDSLFEKQEYLPNRVSSLFDNDFMMLIDEFLRQLVGTG